MAQNPHRRRRADAAGRTRPEHETEEQRRARLLATPIPELGLPVRIINALENAGVFLTGDLVARDRAALTALAAFGDKTMTHLIKAIRELGLDPPAGWKAPRKPRRRRPPRSK